MKKISYRMALLLLPLAWYCAKAPTIAELVQKQVQALGGATTLAAITDQVSKWDAQLIYPMGDSMATSAVEMIITYKRPNKIKFEMFNPDSSLASATVFDGAQGWQYILGEGTRAMLAAEQDENNALAETWIDGFSDYAAKGIKLELLPDTALAGKNYTLVRMTDRFGNVSLNYCDPQSGLMERIESHTTDPTSMTKKPSVMTFSNFTTFDGFTTAGMFQQYDENGTLMFAATLKELQNNTGVSDEAFAAPAPPENETMPDAGDAESVPEAEAQME